MRPQSALETLEAAVHLLRSMPSSSVVLYLFGAVPFHAGLLYFVVDMAHNVFASERLPWESLGLALLLVWKRTWQSCFAASMYQRLSLSEAVRTPWLRLGATQAMLQSVSLVLLPAALLIAFPFPACFAFFRAVGLFTALDEPRPVSAAWRHAVLWPKQNSVVLIVASLAGLLLFANVLIAIALLPQLGRSFLGIEGDLARLGTGILNLSTVAVAMSVTWMILDALLDAAFVIRCFHGESRSSGRDLSVALRRITAVVLVTVALGLSGSTASAQTPAPAAREEIDVRRLDDSIHEVIRQREFAWRTARTPGPESNDRWVGWFRSAWDSLRDFVDWVVDKVSSWFDSNKDASTSKVDAGNPPSLELWLSLIALALVGGTAALLLLRRTPVVHTDSATPIPTAVDLDDTSVTADQLPESSWLALAEELSARGEFRLALRALYLAGLNHLSEVQLVSIRRWKTGRDYRLELERRARILNNSSAPTVAHFFTESVKRFEEGWYGRFPVEHREVEALASSLAEVRRYVRGA